VNRLRDDRADADDGLRERDEPQPAHVGAREHPDVTAPSARGARDALELRVDRDVVQEGIVRVSTEALHQYAGPARGIDHDSHPQRPLGTKLVREAERDALTVERRIEE